MVVPQIQGGLDDIRWRATHDGVYTTNTSYALVSCERMLLQGCWKQLWKCPIPEKIKLFLWLVAREALHTNAKRNYNHLSCVAACPLCVANIEDIDHVLRRYALARQIWRHFGSCIPILGESMPLQDWFQYVVSHHESLLMIEIMWWTWRWRNQQIF